MLVNVKEYLNASKCLLIFPNCFDWQVLKVKMRHNMVSEIIEVYADPDGSEARGSTVATYVNGKVVIGTIEDQTVVCDSKYIM